MKRNAVQHHMDGLMALLLFGVFAVCVLAVLLTGARAYRRLTLRDRVAYDRRTCVQYIATRVRQSDGAGAVTVEELEDTDCLCLSEDIGGERYTTRIYCYDGYLRELFSSADMEGVGPEAGEPVMEAQGLKLKLEDGLLRVAVQTADGEGAYLLLSLRSDGEVAA